jgi:multiple sugar transport system permease protein
VGRLLDRDFHLLAIAPLLVALLLLTIFPALQLVRMSLSEVSLTSGGTVWSFVGLKHLQTLLNDRVALIAFKNTLIFTLVVVPVEAILGLLLAYLVSQVKFLATFYRTILILPLLLPPIAIGALWRLMYDYNYGVINQILLRFNVPGPLWIADPQLALPSVMLVDVWHWTSFMFLIFLAGVQSIPGELHEAAEVDGANPFQVFRFVVLPLLRPTIIVALMMRTILAFKVFDVPYLLTGGGPGTATELINIYIEKVYFQQFRVGYGAMITLVAALILSAFIVIYQRASKRATGTA